MEKNNLKFYIFPRFTNAKSKSIDLPMATTPQHTQTKSAQLLMTKNIQSYKKPNHNQRFSISNMKNIKIITVSDNNIQNINPNETKNRKINPLMEPPKNKILSHSIFFKDFPSYFPAKTSQKSFGYICSYAANSMTGQMAKSNEDRISIIQNVIKPPSRKKEEWPKVSFFAIYDGHEGIKCSDFLKENLHHYVCKI